MPPQNKIKLMIVDDSALVRQVVSMAVAHDPGIEVVATASDPIFALDKMRQIHPDVLLLDIEMPRMDGLTFLRKLMAESPVPVVICSSLAENGSDTAMQALAAGAVSIITKPKSGLKGFLEEASNDIISAVRAAARANVRLLVPRTSTTGNAQGSNPAAPARPNYFAPTSPTLNRPKNSTDVMLPLGDPSGAMIKTTDKVVAIGTSTGGTQALEAVLTKLPVTVPGIVVVQHMPEKFTGMFSERLNSLCAIEVKEAQNNDRVLPGRALIAPGGKHMMLKRSGAQYYVEVADGPLVNRHKPSVDVLFRSVAKFAGVNATGIIMTGMGDDGARGMKEMHDAGARTVAQDEATCVVFGMPKEAIKMGGVDRILPLDQIPGAIVAAGKDN